MIAPRLFECIGARIGPADPVAAGRTRIALDSIGNRSNVNIRFENVGKPFQQQLSPRLVDLLEIAAYVYAADCSTERGTEWSDEGGTEPWARDFSFVISLCEPDFWQSADVNELLTDVLSFLSDDKYSFKFVPMIRTISSSTGRNLETSRFRANLVLEAKDPKPFLEEAWIGDTLRIGDRPDSALLRAGRRDQRCQIVNLDPACRFIAGSDGGDRCPAQKQNNLGAYGTTVRPGTTCVGDTVFLAN